MKNDEHTTGICFKGDMITHELTALPSMAAVFSKALCISPFKSNRLNHGTQIEKHCFVIREMELSRKKIAFYRNVCGFESNGNDKIPSPYLQTLFINLVGKYITSSFFPFNPMGLIQISQSFEWFRPVVFNEKLSLFCELEKITKDEKGYFTDFLLTAKIKKDTVWQGISKYLSKTGHPKKSGEKKDEEPLDIIETIQVPANTGRKYAKASGDFNPHHLYPIFARLFGFKAAIAHGMWSLARTLAVFDKKYSIDDHGRVEAGFKLPVYLPATVTLGCKADDEAAGSYHFELRDASKGLPHLKGKLFI